MFENKLDVLVGEGHQVGANQSHDGVQNCRLDKVHVPNPPKEPWRDNSHLLISEHAVCWFTDVLLNMMFKTESSS